MLGHMDAQQQPSDLKAYADRLERLCRAQADEIGRLRQENETLRSAEGAHDVLRRIDLNEAESSNTRVKAAQASINFEKSKLENVPPPLNLVREPDLPLAEVVRMQRARADAALLTDPQFEAWRNRRHLPSTGVSNGDDSSGNE